MKLPIKGLSCTSVGETFYFYNDKLLADNVIIEYETLLHDDNNPNFISVKHYNEFDAGEWIIYWGPSIEIIQIYRIIKDIFELYNEHSLFDFVQILDGISGSSRSASIQVIEEHKSSLLQEIKEDIELVKGFTEYEKLTGIRK